VRQAISCKAFPSCRHREQPLPLILVTGISGHEPAFIGVAFVVLGRKTRIQPEQADPVPSAKKGRRLQGAERSAAVCRPTARAGSEHAGLLQCEALSTVPRASTWAWASLFVSARLRLRQPIGVEPENPGRSVHLPCDLTVALAFPEQVREQRRVFGSPCAPERLSCHRVTQRRPLRVSMCAACRSWFRAESSQRCLPSGELVIAASILHSWAKPRR